MAKCSSPEGLLDESHRCAHTIHASASDPAGPRFVPPTASFASTTCILPPSACSQSTSMNSTPFRSRCLRTASTTPVRVRTSPARGADALAPPSSEGGHASSIRGIGASRPAPVGRASHCGVLPAARVAAEAACGSGTTGIGAVVAVAGGPGRSRLLALTVLSVSGLAAAGRCGALLRLIAWPNLNACVVCVCVLRDEGGNFQDAFFFCVRSPPNDAAVAPWPCGDARRQLQWAHAQSNEPHGVCIIWGLCGLCGLCSPCQEPPAHIANSHLTGTGTTGIVRRQAAA